MNILCLKTTRIPCKIWSGNKF